MTVFLTNPASSGDSGNITLTDDIVIPAGDTVNIDACSCTNLSTKWIITLYNQLENKVQTAEILASHRFQTNPKHTRYAIVGDKLAYQTDVAIIGGAFVLSVTNNEGFELVASATQIKTTNIG